MQNTYLIIFHSKENCWTYAESGKLRRWLILLPVIPLTLEKRPPIWKRFPHVSHSVLSHTRTERPSDWEN